MYAEYENVSIEELSSQITRSDEERECMTYAAYLLRPYDDNNLGLTSVRVSYEHLAVNAASQVYML